MKTLIYLFVGLFMYSSMLSDDNPMPYKIYDKDGEEVEYSDLLDDAEDSEVVLFGEYHNNSISHFLQVKLAKSLFEVKDGEICFGAEMFEADDQIIIDEYFKDQITEQYFKKEAKLWPNYDTDYKSVFEFAKEHDLKYIATNIPRRYAGFVARNGLQKLNELSKNALEYVAPLPVKYDAKLPGYAALLKPMAMHSKKDDMKKNDTSSVKKEGMMHSKMSSKMKAGGIMHIAEAQAVKDATMAHFILENLTEDYTFLHFNGSYHSDNFEGISWYLKQENSAIKILTISTVEQDNIDELEEENINKADYIIVVDKDMIKTH